MACGPVTSEAACLVPWKGGLEPFFVSSVLSHVFYLPFLLASLNLFLHCLSLPLPSKSGLPALLSLLLCIIPGKAIHITYEPGWQALGADASSSLQQVTFLDSTGEEWDPSASHTSSLSVLACFYANPLLFVCLFCFCVFLNLFFHLVALKLSPGSR